MRLVARRADPRQRKPVSDKAMFLKNGNTSTRQTGWGSEPIQQKI